MIPEPVYHIAQTPMPPRVLDELAGWQDRARMWPLRFILADPHARCEVCDQSVIPLADGTGTGYLYSPEQALTLTVAHIRQVHDPNS